MHDIELKKFPFTIAFPFDQPAYFLVLNPKKNIGISGKDILVDVLEEGKMTFKVFIMFALSLCLLKSEEKPDRCLGLN